MAEVPKSVEDVRNFYTQNFDPGAYRNRLINRDGGKLKEEEKFFFKAMFEIFQDPSFRGTTLLDLGSGPTVHNIAPASSYYSDIILSDYVDTNREELEKWLRKDPDALDWTRLLLIAAEMEGFSDVEQGKLILEDRIRNVVKHVVYCDVLADPMVPSKFDREYDLVMTSLTFEAAVPNYEAFKDCIKKTYLLVKPNGKFIMKGFLNGGQWKSGNYDFPYLPLTQQDITNALETAGFSNIHWMIMERADEDYEYQFEGCYVLSCTK